MTKKSNSRFSNMVKFVSEEEIQDEQMEENFGGIKTNKLPTESPKERTAHQVLEETPEIPEPEEEIFEEKISDDVYNDIFVGSNQDNYDDINEDDEEDIEEDIEEIKEEMIIPQPKQTGETKMENNASVMPRETIILGNTTIKGDIITDTGIQIYGAVLGNIESGGRVQLVGKVEGDITGDSVVVTNTMQTGNISAKKDVYIKEGCTINGNIEASRVFLKGSVIGDISANGQVDFEVGSEIQGNVTAKSFNIKPGAKINGTIGTI